MKIAIRINTKILKTVLYMRKLIYRILSMPKTNTHLIFINGTHYALSASYNTDECAIICNVLNDLYNGQLKECYEKMEKIEMIENMEDAEKMEMKKMIERGVSKWNVSAIYNYFHFDKIVEEQLQMFNLDIYFKLECDINDYRNEISNFQYIKFFTMGQHRFKTYFKNYKHRYYFIPTDPISKEAREFTKVARTLVSCYWRLWCNEM